jgi:type I site-specific restriction endonuclease
VPLNEADTRAQLIDPRLQAAGWTHSQVTREHYYNRDQAYTAGRIRLRGNRASHGQPRRVDYLLRYTDAFPIAVVEAKAEAESAEAGLEQAKGYARDLGTAFAYATNGHAIIEYDFFTHQSQELTTFPHPHELWRRWQRNTGLSQVGQRTLQEIQAAYTADRFQNPLLYPYAPHRITGKEPRYYQEGAITQAIRRSMRGQQRMLLTLATGTGKTFIAFQIAWKLIKSGWLNRLHQDRPGRILFLADRVVLRDLKLDEIKTIRIAEDEIERYKLETGDLLLTEGGDFDKLGRGAVWRSEIELCIHQNHVFAVRFNQSEVLPEFAEYEMQSWYAKTYFLSVAKRTTNLASINKTQLSAFPIRYPPKKEQQSIMRHLDSVKTEIEAMQQIQTQDAQSLEQIEQAILAQAFQGEL